MVPLACRGQIAHVAAASPIGTDHMRLLLLEEGGMLTVLLLLGWVQAAPVAASHMVAGPWAQVLGWPEGSLLWNSQEDLGAFKKYLPLITHCTHAHPPPACLPSFPPSQEQGSHWYRQKCVTGVLGNKVKKTPNYLKLDWIHAWSQKWWNGKRTFYRENIVDRQKHEDKMCISRGNRIRTA